jgi:glutamate decarboxylase
MTEGSTFPIVVLRADDAQTTDLTELSSRLRERGWIVPAYRLPANAQNITVLRMVVKENFSRDMVDMLSHDVRDALQTLRKQAAARVSSPRRRPLC